MSHQERKKIEVEYILQDCDIAWCLDLIRALFFLAVVTG